MSGEERETDEPHEEGVTARTASDGSTADGDERSGGPPVSLSPTAKSSLLWTAIGALTFLVLVQGFEIWSGERVSFLVKFAVAAVVAVVAGGATYLLQGRVPAANESA